jgi:hypothetical protein
LDREIEQGFPHLPTGCVIQLERIAQQRVLDNVRESVRLLRPKMIGSLRDLGRYLGRAPSLDETLEYLDITIDELLKRGLWSRLLTEAGLAHMPNDPDEERLAKGVLRLCHVDCSHQILRWQQMLEASPSIPSTEEDRRLIEMLLISLWGDDSRGWTIAQAWERLSQNSAALRDLRSILEHRLLHAPTHHAGRIPDISGPLTIHAQYTRDEILVGLGHWSLDRRPDQREGVLHLATSKVDAFFVTLQKTEEEYSPTTMYEDYLISQDRFHWQSQSNTSAKSATGERYINHASLGYTPMLFVREAKLLPSGLSAPYFFLGPCEYLSHEGSRPISIVWKLVNSVPARLFRVMARQNVA